MPHSFITNQLTTIMYTLIITLREAYVKNDKSKFEIKVNKLTTLAYATRKIWTDGFVDENNNHYPPISILSIRCPQLINK